MSKKKGSKKAETRRAEPKKAKSQKAKAETLADLEVKEGEGDVKGGPSAVEYAADRTQAALGILASGEF